MLTSGPPVQETLQLSQIYNQTLRSTSLCYCGHASHYRSCHVGTGCKLLRTILLCCGRRCMYCSHDCHETSLCWRMHEEPVVTAFLAASCCSATVHHICRHVYCNTCAARCSHGCLEPSRCWLQYCAAEQENEQDAGTGAVVKCLVANNQSLTTSCLGEVQRLAASALLLYQPVSCPSQAHIHCSQLSYCATLIAVTPMGACFVLVVLV